MRTGRTLRFVPPRPLRLNHGSPRPLAHELLRSPALAVHHSLQGFEQGQRGKPYPSSPFSSSRLCSGSSSSSRASTLSGALYASADLKTL